MAKYLLYSRRHVWQEDSWRMIMSGEFVIQPGMACHQLLAVSYLIN